MSLDKGALKIALESLFANRFETCALAAQAWGNIVDTYASGAVDELGNAVGTRNLSSLVSGLTDAFSQTDYVITMSKMNDAFSAYWSGVTFDYSNVPSDGQPGSGQSNTVTNTGSGFSFSTTSVSTWAEGASNMADSVDNRMKTVRTTIHYLTPPPSSSPTSKVLSIH